MKSFLMTPFNTANLTHFNTRSLAKNMNLISLPAEVVTISETKIEKNFGPELKANSLPFFTVIRLTMLIELE